MDLTASPTQTLVERIVHGDEQATQVLLSRYRETTRQYASGRLPSSARGRLDTEDLIQDVMLGALRNIKGFDAEKPRGFLLYLRTAVNNKLRNLYRDSGNQPNFANVDSNLADRRPSPIEEFLGRRAEESYESGLMALTDLDRELVVARVEFQLSFAEMATHFGKPSSDAARVAFKRAILKLAEQMPEQT